MLLGSPGLADWGFLESMGQAAWVNLLVNKRLFLSIIESGPSLVYTTTEQIVVGKERPRDITTESAH